MVKLILSRLHPRPERRGFTLHMDKTKNLWCFDMRRLYIHYQKYSLTMNELFINDLMRDH
jgi:hypothetical protein